jgi:tetratricopeptide (TPR) repeat protein
MSNITVFISYSHDSDEHRERVLALSERLRADGIETLLDQYVNGSPREGWPRWMLDQLDKATHVLVVCTPTYYRRFRGHEEPGKGKGVDWEGALIASELYLARSRSLKFVPVFLSAPAEECIPEPLRSTTHYVLTSEAVYQSLYDFLLQQSGVEPGPVGTLKPKARGKGSPLTFAPSAPDAPAVDISRIIKYAPDDFVGREQETQALDEAWSKVRGAACPRPHVFTFVALGGEGKTSVVANWAAGMAAADWPACEAAFAWSFYSQGSRDQAAVSSEFFLGEALRFFGDAAMAASPQGAFEKGQRLAQLVGERRALLILDGLEPLQYPPTAPAPGELKDKGIAALLKGLAAKSQGLCIVTTRYALPDLRVYRQTTAPEHELLRLSKAEGVLLLGKLGVTGSKEELARLVEDVDGHALTLQIMGAFLKRAFHGDIRCRDRVNLDKADAKTFGGHAFRAMAAYETWMEGESDEARRELAILRLLGLFDRPATADCLAALQRPPAIPGLTEALTGLAEDDWNLSIDALQSAKLITANREHGSGQLIALDAHPLLREYFGQRLRDAQPEACKTGHRQLYRHLCETTREGEEPTLADLQPLYQAVANGCQAELHQEACEDVYRDRIQRGRESYAANRLGALGSNLGVLARFFETPWSRISPLLSKPAQAWLLNEVGTHLLALGRLAEAMEPMRAGLPIELRTSDWENAAARASNLGELAWSLGEVGIAVDYAEQSVTYADRGNDVSWKIGSRATHATALHEAGRRSEAEARFREAEQIQAKYPNGYPLLHLVRGFRYCDLLLAPAEREAGKVEAEGESHRLLALCQAVAKRAAQTLKAAKHSRQWLIDFALDHLTIGRATLYAAILESRGHTHLTRPAPEVAQRDLNTAAAELGHAVSGLRSSGEVEFIPLGLLSRAWLRSLTVPLTGADSAQSDLDEAWEIAERGPMPLFLADIHLYRARLFFREPNYPWQSAPDDLREARRLIEKHGYGRRKEEMEDAEAAILGKSGGDASCSP